VAQRVSEVTELVPWLRPGQSHSELRRTARRLRTRQIRLPDPRISPDLLAHLIERAIEQELLVNWMMAELGQESELHRVLEERNEHERVRHAVAGFHRLKESPEASDPESAVAQRLRRMHRERRREMGRARRK